MSGRFRSATRTQRGSADRSPYQKPPCPERSAPWRPDLPGSWVHRSAPGAGSPPSPVPVYSAGPGRHTAKRPLRQYSPFTSRNVRKRQRGGRVLSAGKSRAEKFSPAAYSASVQAYPSFSPPKARSSLRSFFKPGRCANSIFSPPYQRQRTWLQGGYVRRIQARNSARIA